jgi:hypothetical protein
MVPTQDFLLLGTPVRALIPLDLVPALVVATVLVAFAVALVTVSLRRRDAD